MTTSTSTSTSASELSQETEIENLLYASMYRLGSGIPQYELKQLIQEAEQCEDALKKEIKILEDSISIPPPTDNDNDNVDDVVDGVKSDADAAGTGTNGDSNSTDNGNTDINGTKSDAGINAKNENGQSSTSISTSSNNDTTTATTSTTATATASSNPIQNQQQQQQQQQQNQQLQQAGDSINKSNAPIKKKTCPLTQERVDKLLTLGFKFVIGKGQYSAFHGTFTSSDTMIKAWEEKFNLLKEYKKLYGHVDVPIKPSLEGCSVGVGVGVGVEVGAGVGVGDNALNNGDRTGSGSDDVGYDKVQESLDHLNPHGHPGNGDNHIEQTNNGINFNHHNNSSSTRPHLVDGLHEDQIKSLARWLKLQKQKYKKIGSDILSSNSVVRDRCIRLADLGVDLGSIRDTSTDGNEKFGHRSTHGKSARFNCQWEARYNELCEFKEKYGHVCVSQNDQNNHQLARWVTTQRELYKTRQRQFESEQNKYPSEESGSAKLCNSLTDERVTLLENIGFHFSMYDKTFKERVRELKLYKEKNGHMHVRSFENKTLYDWVHRQRYLFRDYMQGSMENRRYTMTTERIKLLEDIGFDWQYTFEAIDPDKVKLVVHDATQMSNRPQKKKKSKASNSNNKKVEGSNALLFCGKDTEESSAIDLGNKSDKLFLKTNSDLQSLSPLDSNQQVDGSELIPFPVVLDIHNQTTTEEIPDTGQNLQNLVGTNTNDTEIFLCPQQHKKGTKPHLWNQNYNELVKFQREHGHCRVPGVYPKNKKLGYWVKLQREDHKHLEEGKPSPMNDHRIKMLEDIDFQWSVSPFNEKQIAWYTKLEQLKAYKKQNHNCDVPQAYKPNPSLGKWVSKQRDAYRDFKNDKKSCLTQEKMKILESISFRFYVGKGRAQRQWDNFFDSLVLFKQKFGHTNIPLSYSADPQLGRWAYQQRLNYMKKNTEGKGLSSLTNIRLNRLQDIGFSFHLS